MRLHPSRGASPSLSNSFFQRAEIFRSGDVSLPVMPDLGKRSDSAADAVLVRRAEAGNAEAWATLVDRYAAYVYSVLGASRVPESDMPDAFQYVFIELFRHLPNLRNREGLAPWLRQTALRHGVRLRVQAERGPGALEDLELVPDARRDHEQVEQAEQAGLIHEAIAGLKERCRELIRRLFFADPPQPYAEVAKALGIQIGSIGMTRQRCLDELERALRARGIH